MNQTTNKSQKKGINPAAVAGVAVAAGAVGAAAAAYLSDEQRRKRIIKNLENLKNQAQTLLEDLKELADTPQVQETIGMITDKAKTRIEEALPEKTRKKTKSTKPKA